jgi:succinate dehydrogenase / fumarate reductase, cytochrome b subunit
VKHLNLAVHLGGKAMTRGVVASNRLMALWPTVIGKKVVMAVTGLVLIGFVIAHMLSNLKVFAGPNGIKACSQFLREVGWPELGYGQLLWVVRIVPFVFVTLRITAAIQLLARHERPLNPTIFNEGNAFADDERGNVHYGRIGNEAERRSYT